MNNTFGLKETNLEKLIAVLHLQPKVEEAYIFGSRAKGNYKNGSDIYIALKGEKLNFESISHISYLLNEETNRSYKFDVLNYKTITSNDLVEHIDQLGINFYKQNQ